MTTHFDDFDHETHMRESNRIVTESDIRRHPELHLAYRACREYDADERAEMVSARRQLTTRSRTPVNDMIGPPKRVSS
ncbi:hypothetical protein GCM10007209_27480 [Haloferax sulfurifontis]|uniref:Cytidine/deoxycytidylate deaminase, zinc-binding region (TBD) n=2 Tax=Haloferax sulfurifontis TaxID=255616 RepID=M0IJW2_9EURY|nr:Cytidine/deoxycytidylate deaminase, zinc-binding region (TBD) [Haloferax sulfurifontis ATCC BAA-897]GGC63918.1 hypothetical protein GCM10007209_27480 [Haloferax sulfurifontis]